MTSVEAGLRFKTLAGLVVETTGVTLHIGSTEVHVHEVEIVEGNFKGKSTTTTWTTPRRSSGAHPRRYVTFYGHGRNVIMDMDSQHNA